MTGAAAAPVGTVQPAALLIDADNFGDPAHILDAYNRLRQQVGSVQVCRAYGAAARLQALNGVWQKIGARTFPNLALSVPRKNLGLPLVAASTSAWRCSSRFRIGRQ